MLRISSCIAAFAVALHAQCPRPELPPGGHTVEVRPIETVTYSDSVVTEAHLVVPVGPAPVCGWPLVVHIHPLGSSHVHDLAWQQEIASNGYAVWAYDVRGQGAARTLNPTAGTTLYSGNERFDLAEQIAHVRATYPLEVSQDLVAVTGNSQGGIHSWMAAVQSGQPLTVPGRGTVQFPVISAVAGADFVTEPLEHRVRGGTLFSSYFIDITTLDPTQLPFQIDSAMAAEVAASFINQDPARLETWMQNDPGRLLAPDLAQTTVPIFFSHAWHDSICGPGPIVEALEDIPATTPVRLLLSTIGHSVPNNDYELGLKQELTLRWFERFLWDEQNGVELETPHVLARMPLDPTEFTDSSHPWEHVIEEQLPAADVTPLRLFTAGDGTLAETESPNGPPSHIFHHVQNDFTPQSYLQDPNIRTAAEVLARIPLSEATFTYTLANDMELAGAPRVHVHLTSTASRFTIAALLSAQIPGALEPRMLTHWGRGLIDAPTDAPVDLEFDLGPIATTLPAGTVLELSIRNHWLPEAPHLAGFVTVPMFTDSNVTITHDAGTEATWLDLPVRTERRATLVATTHVIDSTQPGAYPFTIDAGPERDGWVYLLGASFSGQAPGIDLPGGNLPLNPDQVTILFGEAINTRELRNFAGLVDPAGHASPTLDLSAMQGLSPVLIGTRVTLAAWVFRSEADPSGVPTNAVDLYIR